VVTSGHRRFRGTAGRRLSSSCSWVMPVGDSDCRPAGRGRRRRGSRRAATGVRNDRGTRPKTVEDYDRRSCHRRPLAWRFSCVFPRPQHHAVPCRNARYRSRTEEARGSNPLTSTPNMRRSERRQPRAGGAHRMLRPRCGRKLKSQCSPKALRGQPTQAQASHNDHVAWSPPAASRWAILARIQPLPVGLAQC
jgi:hypothetical protein